MQYKIVSYNNYQKYEAKRCSSTIQILSSYWEINVERWKKNRLATLMLNKLTTIQKFLNSISIQNCLIILIFNSFSCKRLYLSTGGTSTGADVECEEALMKLCCDIFERY